MFYLQSGEHADTKSPISRIGAGVDMLQIVQLVFEKKLDEA